MNIGEKLRAVRKQRRYTMVDVAEKTGINQPYLSKIERGLVNNPSLDVINTLSRFYEIDIKWLLSDYGYKPSPESEANEPISNNDIVEEIRTMLYLLSPDDLSLVKAIIEIFITERGKKNEHL